MTDESILNIIFAKDKEKGKVFWPEIGMLALPRLEIVYKPFN